MAVRFFELDADPVGPVGQVARQSTRAPVVLGRADAEGGGPLARLPGVEAPEHELAPIEEAVVALGRGAKLEQRARAAVRHANAQVERLARLHGVVRTARRHLDRDLARTAVGAGRPVHAEPAELGHRAAHLVVRDPLDDRARVGEHLVSSRALRVAQELAREAQQELVLLFVLDVVVGIGVAKALSFFAR